jgi:actin-related protein
MGSRLHNATIVIDNGSGTIRAGFAGEDVPKIYIPSYVGRPKHVRTMAGALEGDVFIGPPAKENQGLFKINYPLEHGIVTDWDDMERIWQYVYNEGLKTMSEDVSKIEGIGALESSRRAWWGTPLTMACSIAPSTPHRTATEPSRKPRGCRPDTVRDI